MSRDVRKHYNKIFKQLITEKGFKQKKDLFYKLVNDQILQTVYLQINSYGHSFTINIGILPLCSGLEYEDEYTFRLGHLLKGYDYSWEYGLYNSLDEESLVKDAFLALEEKVFPIFKRITNYEEYFNHIPDIEEAIYGSRRDNNSSMIWVSLITYNYDNAVLILEKLENQNREAAEANKVLYTKEDEYNIYLKKINDELSELVSLRIAVQKRDSTFLESKLRQNEEISRKLLGMLGL